MRQLRVWGTLFVGSALAAGCGGSGRTSPPNPTKNDAAPASIDVAPDRADAGPDRADAPPGPADIGTQVQGDTSVAWDEGVDSSCLSPVTPPPPPPAGSLSEDESIAPAAVGCLTTSTWCGPAVCGNGTIDSCSVAVRGTCGTTTIKAVSESCDGTSLNGASCQTLGYAGGTLACTSTCTYDVRECTTCAPAGSNSALISCALVAVTSPETPFNVALAASATELAMAWVYYADNATTGVGFARFDSKLSPLSQIANLPGAGESNNRPSQVALVPLGDGWELLIRREHDGKMMVLDATGRPTGVTRVLPGAYDLAAVAPPTGAPLITWTEILPQDFDAGVPEPEVYVLDGGITKVVPPYLGPLAMARAALLAPDGVTLTAPLTLFTSPYGDRSAAFIGDGFLVAERTQRGLEVARVETSGASGGPARLLLSPDAYEFPRLEWEGGITRLIYGRFYATVGAYAVNLDRTGAMVGAPVSLGTEIGFADALMVQQDSVVLRAGQSGRDQYAPFLDLLRLDGGGNPVRPPVRIAGDPQGARGYTMVRSGSDAVVAWITGACPGRLQLARVTP